MGIIRRSCSFLDGKLFKKLYITFVRPHLEYAQAVWAPYLAKYVNMLEKVQIRATKLIDGFKNVEYSDRLRRYDQKTLRKSFKPRDRLSRKHTFQLIPNSSKDGTRGVQKNSFYHRAIDKWNELPEYVVNAKNINIFKNALDKYWNDIPMQFTF